MTVSVVIPVYNAAETLPATLASLSAQTLPPAEVILIDDASPDPATQAYLQSLPDHLEHATTPIPLRLLRQAVNQGAPAAHNRGIAAATSDFIAFLDADDIWEPEKLARCVPLLATHDYLCHDFYLGLERTTVVSSHASANRSAYWQRHPLLHLLVRNYIATSTVIIRREILLAVGGFDEALRYVYDWDLWLRVGLQLGTAPHIVAEPLSFYRLSPGGLTSKILLCHAVKEQIVCRHAAAVARREGRAMLPTYLRGWLSIHLETGLSLLKTRAFADAAKLTFGAPLRLLRDLPQVGNTPSV